MSMSETSQAEQLRPRAVVYLYTQTGQLREVAEALTAPMTASGWDVRWVGVEPREAFPFPWPIGRFFGVFAQAVDPSALVELVVPPGGFDTAPDELVILACQVWYLAPSLPVRSLVTRHPEAVQGRDVITLVACRNMWYSAMVEMSQLLRRAGARRVDVVAATDTRPSSTTLVTTLRWLLTGRRGPFLRFGRAGVGDDELARVAQVGQRIANSRQCPQDAAPVMPALAAADLVAGKAFRRWGTVVRSARRFGSAVPTATLIGFVLGLAVAIVVGLPLIALVRASRRRCAASSTAGSPSVNPRPTRWRLHDSRHNCQPVGKSQPEFAEPMKHAKPTSQDLAEWLTANVARSVNVTSDAIDVDTPLADYGIDSAASLTLCADLQAEKGITVETTIVWDYPTIDAIVAHLVSLGIAS